MKLSYYPVLAFDGIRKNKRMYLPYLLTSAGMVMMTYIIKYLDLHAAAFASGGGETISMFLNIGYFVIVFFSALFLFYTNSFLVRRRKKEFGLYNILGMGKASMIKILLWETLSAMTIALAAGLAGGIAASKLFELLLVRMTEGKLTYAFTVSQAAILYTALPFAGIFLLLLLNSIRQVWFSTAIALIRSENAGEKPPRGNWILGTLGVIALAVAYDLAITIDDPVTATAIFAVAVLLVIAATYLIMIAGSVLFCRILQRRKSYYYQPNHFVSVSGMVYRMKRNGAGLASICILATMVLVMIASTSALYIGGEDVLNTQYPRNINAYLRAGLDKGIAEEDKELVMDSAKALTADAGTKMENLLSYDVLYFMAAFDGGKAIFDPAAMRDVYENDYVTVHLVSIDDYNAVLGTHETLEPDEVLVYGDNVKYKSGVFGLEGREVYRVKKVLKGAFHTPDMLLSGGWSSLLVIANDPEGMCGGLRDRSGGNIVQKKWCYCFDTALEREEEAALSDDLKEALGWLQMNGQNGVFFGVNCRAVEREEFFLVYGGIFYLGIILSIVFLFAAVLIIYYKQISEGYEDQAKFEIMQKVGMTKREIRKSINSQMLTLFFLPLLFAGLHLAFAFPIINKILLLFELRNRSLFILTTIGSYLVYAVFYTIVYRITARHYYQIVSGKKNA